MAKIKHLKSDINYLTYEILGDCTIFMEINPDKKDEIVKILEDTIVLRNELIKKVNSKEDRTKKHFQGIREELFTYADKTFEQLRTFLN